MYVRGGVYIINIFISPFPPINRKTGTCWIWPRRRRLRRKDKNARRWRVCVSGPREDARRRPLFPYFSDKYKNNRYFIIMAVSPSDILFFFRRFWAHRETVLGLSSGFYPKNSHGTLRSFLFHSSVRIRWKIASRLGCCLFYTAVVAPIFSIFFSELPKKKKRISWFRRIIWFLISFFFSRTSYTISLATETRNIRRILLCVIVSGKKYFRKNRHSQFWTN